jgi:hypothetical protein
VKGEEAGRAVTRVEPLDPQVRVEELARMLAGRVVTDAARENAAALLALAHRDRSAGEEVGAAATRAGGEGGEAGSPPRPPRSRKVGAR